MKVVWSRTAVADLATIRSYIGKDRPLAANRVAQRIRDAVQQLRGFPLSGREGRESGTRELVISGTPYVVVYVITPNQVSIATVLHGKQLWPKPE